MYKEIAVLFICSFTVIFANSTPVDRAGNDEMTMPPKISMQNEELILPTVTTLSTTNPSVVPVVSSNGMGGVVMVKAAKSAILPADPVTPKINGPADPPTPAPTTPNTTAPTIVPAVITDTPNTTIITTTPIPTTPNTTTPNTTTPTPVTPTTNTTTVTTPTTTDGTTPKPTVAPVTTTPGPSPTPAPSKDRRFDGPSFIGGIVLSVGIIAIGFVAWKFYKARTERNYHTL